MPKSFEKRLQEFLVNKFGIQIYRVKQATPEERDKKPKSKMIYVHDPAYSYMPQPEFQEKLQNELVEVADSFFSKGYFPNLSGLETKALIKEFFDLYSNRTKTENTHGSGFHNAFWLYLITRTLDPEIIVESGVWKGHSSWLMNKACPEADLYGFDISLSYFEFPKLKSRMHKQDWKSFTFPDFDPERSLIFFDCHVNHAQRILEAKSKGFKHLLIDDNPPLHKIFTHVPGIPTAAMLFENQGLDLDEITWYWNGDQYTEPIDRQQALDARQLIKQHVVLPNVGSITRYGGFGFLTYVQI